MKLNILPNPITCANVPGGVNSVVADHALGFLAAGYEVNANDGLNIIHALAQSADIDVFHCHGLYPIGDGYFDKSYSRANDIVLKNALKAKITICISEFSANILRHKLHIDPVVTRNGIWTKDYRRGGSETGAILFPKASLDANAKPDDMLWLKDNSDFDLLSIAKIQGVKSTGKLSRKDFLTTLADCSVYLGTTKENNSMATMEAMVMGIPMVGYDIGFNAEWLISGTGCELVPFGDQLALKDALARVRSNWQKYSADARAYAEIFDWQPVINELLGIYEKVNNAPEDRTVSIVITCHNYEQWIGEAIQSALDQTIACEVIVIDDKSTDNSLEIIKRYPVTIIENEINLGVAETRNKAIKQAQGTFIICLDADDKIYPDFAEKHLAAFRTQEDAIAYAPINLVDERGRPRKQNLFTAKAAPSLQAIGRNQVPSCCMFRKSFWARAGGYDKRYTPAEDANLWLKIFQLGGLAHFVHPRPLMDYRIHGNSLSAKGFPSWWLGSQTNFSAPIEERDANISIILDECNERTKDFLWSLENQSYQKWACLLRSPNGLKESFPWLNLGTRHCKSLLHLNSETALPSNFLTEYMKQTPEWIEGTLAPSR
jgi:glycosyltransferase involved in cell wall biosynthesis